MMSANSRIRFGLQIVFVCLYITPSHYHHCANFIWRHWTYKMPVRYNLSSMWVRLSIFSQLSIIQYMGLCIFSLPISFVMIERIYIVCLIIIIKSEAWTITHCLWLGHETMVCAVCLSIFFFYSVVQWPWQFKWTSPITLIHVRLSFCRSHSNQRVISFPATTNWKATVIICSCFIVLANSVFKNGITGPYGRISDDLDLQHHK